MKKLLIFSNVDWHFYSHLLPIAIAAKRAGYQVSLLTQLTNCREEIENNDIRVIPISMSRKSLNPFRELISLIKIITIIYKEQPDILHNFTIKPIVYGSIASWLCLNNLKVINNFLGMGFVFINYNFMNSLIRKLISIVLTMTSKFRNMLLIVQNCDDKQLLLDYSITAYDNVMVQCSVGIDTTKFEYFEDTGGKIIFALVSRMLIDKGVNEYVAAAKIIKNKNIEAEFWLVGAPDEGNKSSLTTEELNLFDKEGIVRYLGFQNVEQIWQKAHVAVLPSYREGLSRSLLEAGAYGRAIITTDAPGGRELVTHKVNGLLVKPKDVQDLANAIELLASDSALREKLGKQIREDVLNKYDAKIIASNVINLYDNI